MDENTPIELESKNIIYNEPEDEGGSAAAEGEKGAKKKKRITPLRVVLIVFCALMLAVVGTLGAILIPELIIDNSEYSKTFDGKLILYAAAPDKLGADGSYIIKDSYLGMPVVAIREGAFAGMDGLHSVTIPDTVSSIGAGAFSGCYSLESVHLPESLTEIEDNAFNGCSQLTEIRLPEGLEALGSRVFFGCKSLTTIYLPSTLQFLGEGAFLNCNALTGFVMEKPSQFLTVDSYGNLYNYDEKTLIRYAPACGEFTYTLPSHTTRIAAYAFDGATSLSAVNLHGEVFMIEHNAFSNCEQITIYISLPEEFNTPWDISWNSSGCKVVFDAVVPPDEDDNTGENPSDGENSSTRLAYLLSDDGTYYIVSGIGNCTDREIVIPAEYNGLPVKEIAESAFEYSTKPTRIVIPDSVTKIGHYAFWNCTNLTSITIGSSVTEMGNFILSSCYALSSITVADGNTAYRSIDGNLYTSDGRTLIQYAIGKTDATFELSSSVCEIKGLAFAFASALTSITVADGNTTYSATDGNLYSFDGKTLILYAPGKTDTHFSIPKSVTKINANAFNRCDKLISVIIPSTVTEIDSYAFYDCSHLTIYCEAESLPSGWNSNWNPDSRPVVWGFDESFVLPDESSEFLTYSYDDTTMTATVTGYTGSYAHVTIPNMVDGYTVTSIGSYALRSCSNLTSVTIGSSVTSIGYQAFSDCSSLTSIMVEAGNTAYKSIDGNLYRIDGESLTLIQYAIGKTDTHFTIPDSVTEIGNSAFSSCTKLTSVTIPSSVTSIAGSAFRSCSGLTSVNIPDSVTSIGSGAFYECESLTSVTIPSSVTSIGSYAFALCYSLTSVTIPSSVTSIGDGAFADCSSLTSIMVEAGNTAYKSIDGNLYRIDGESLTLIQYAIGKTDTHFTIPDSVTEIGNSAFSSCTKLTSVTIPSSVTSIAGSAFADCSSLTSVYYQGTESQWNEIPIGSTNTLLANAVYYYSEHAPTSHGNFWHYVDGVPTVWAEYVEPSYAQGLEYTLSTDGTYYIISGIGTCTQTALMIPMEHEGLPIKEIGDRAFESCSNLTSVTIPTSITKIGKRAFCDCLGLTSIIIPDSVTSIDEMAFYSCQGLTSITFSSSLSSIAYGAFAYCTALTSVTIPDGITSIGTSAFAYCDNLLSVTVGNKVSTIDESAFSTCYRLVEIINRSSLSFSLGSTGYGRIAEFAKIIHSGESLITEQNGYLFLSTESVNYLLTYQGSDRALVLPSDYNGQSYVITSDAFRGMSDITSVTIPAAVTEIGTRAFQGCKGLLAVTTGGGVKVVRSFAFAECSSLTDAMLGACVESIEAQAFYYCESLTGIGFGTVITEIGESAFAGCTKLSLINLPSSLLSVGKNAFADCALTSVTIPESITVIPYGLFSGCTSLESVSISSALVEIKSSAFKGCTALSSINIPDTTRKIGNLAFDGCAVIEVVEGVSYVGAWVIDCEPSPTEKQVVVRAGTIGIAQSAFDNCAGLVGVTLPEGVRYIGVNAFYGCNQLTSITLPSTLTNIDFYAFGYCSELASIYLPLSVETIGELAFSACSILTIYAEAENAGEGWHENYNPQMRPVYFGVDEDFVFPDESSSLLTYSYDDTTMTATATGYTGTHTHITVPTMVNGYTVTAIGDMAFDNLKNLTGITLPDTITSIGASAFAGCPSLVSITLPPALTSIGNYAFSGCETLVEVINLSTLNVVAGHESLGKVAFYAKEIHKGESKIVRVGDYLFYTYGGTNYLLAYVGADTVLTLPENYNGESYAIYRYAFAENISIKSVTVPDSVTAIGDGAFTNCYALTSVTLGNGILSIGNEAFAACGELSSINIPTALETIGNNAFWACNMTSVVLPDTLTEIGEYAFSTCRSLTSVTLGTSLAKIGAYAFEDCTSLPMIVIPANVSALGARVFSDCSALTIYCEAESQPTGWNASFNPNNRPIVWGITAPDESSAFLTYSYDDTTMTATVTGYTGSYSHVKIPSMVDGYTVSAIGTNAFKDCAALEGVTVPNSVTSIENYAFSNCSALTSIHLPDVLTSIGAWAFSYCTSLSSITIPDSVTVMDYAAFDGCSNLTSITLSSSLSAIADYAFYNCTALTAIDLPTSIGAIGERAFSYCASLSSIILPDSVNEIGPSAFSSCTSLTSITLPHSLTSLGQKAFYNCSGLTSIIIPSSVNEIGQNAFSLCSSLSTIYCEAASQPEGWDSSWNPDACPVVWGFNESFVLPDESSAFLTYSYDDTTMTATVTGYTGSYSHVTIPSFVNGYRITAISAEAFYICDNLTSITIPDSVTEIGDYAFAYCSSLTSVTIPSSVTEIGAAALTDCSSLTDITVVEGNTVYKSIDGNLYRIGGESLTLIQYAIGKTDTHFDIPDSVTEIGDSAFYWCTNLTSVTIPDSVTEIGYRAFYGCSSLTSVTIPDSVTKIGEWAFYGCSSLTSVTIPDSVTKIGEWAFRNCSNLTIYCEAESKPTGWDSDWNPDACTVVWGITAPDESSAFLTYSYDDTTMTATVTDYTGELTAVTVPTLVNGYTVIAIGDEAFRGCSNVTKITLPPTITSIGTRAFFACSKLNSITLGSAVTHIGDFAFMYCRTLTEITVIDGNTAYKSIDGNLYSLDEKTLIQYAIGKTNTDFTVPNTVQTIGDNAFYYCQSLVRVTIPDSVTVIGASAFSNCIYLQQLSLGNSLTTIKASAFSNCRELNAITLPETLERIESSAFGTCARLNTISIPDSVTFIGENAFNSCESLTSVTIGSGVNEIGSMAFVNCASLTSITVDSGNTAYVSISGNLYSADGKTLIQYATAKTDTSFTVPDSVTVIGTYAFFRSNNLTSVTLSDSVTTIGTNAFFNCEGLQTITLGKGVAQIENGALEAPNLSSILVDADNSTYCDIDGNLYSKDGTTLVQYAIGKTDTYFVVADTVTSISAYAFSGCINLNSIIIPESVSYIGEFAFISCVFLTINCEASEQPEGWDANWNAGGCTVIWGDKLS